MLFLWHEITSLKLVMVDYGRNQQPLTISSKKVIGKWGKISKLLLLLSLSSDSVDTES